MKKVTLFFTAVTFFLLLVASCSVFSFNSSLKYSYQFAPGQVTNVYNAKVFQTLDKDLALAKYKNGSNEEVVFAVRTDEVALYDGLIFSGDFVMVDTYTYETVPDIYGRSFMKTVPLVTTKSLYLKSINNEQ